MSGSDRRLCANLIQPLSHRRNVECRFLACRHFRGKCLDAVHFLVLPVQTYTTKPHYFQGVETPAFTTCLKSEKIISL